MNWYDLRGLNYGASGRPTTGVIRYTDPEGSRTERFLYAPARSWRREDEEGVVQIQNTDHLYVRRENGMEIAPSNDVLPAAFGHPSQLLQAFQLWPIGPFNMPMAPESDPEQIEVRGRKAWLVHFGDRQITMSVTFDDITGLIVRWQQGDQVSELLEFDLVDHIDPAQFTCNGPTVEAPPDVRTRWENKLDTLRDMPLPTVGYWPMPVQTHLLDGDLDTGASVMNIAGQGELAGWRTDQPVEAISARLGWQYTRSWVADGWSWRLQTRDPLTESDFTRFVDELIVPSPSLPEPVSEQRVFDGRINVAYGQFYLQPDGLFGDGDMDASFRGQLNGLCGVAVPNLGFFIVGLHTGSVALTIDILLSRPALDDDWEDVVEVSYAVSNPPVKIYQWEGDAAFTFPLDAGQYRIRYSAIGMDDAADYEREGDRYLIQMWPAPRMPEQIMKTRSRTAAYWHGAMGQVR